MPRLRLFRDTDPFQDSDIIPFPGLRRERARLRLVDDRLDAAHEAERAVENLQRQLDDARKLLCGGMFDDDGPRAA